MDLNQVVDQLSGLTIAQAVELTKLLEEKWGVSASAAVAVQGAGNESAAANEQTKFDVLLKSAGSQKLQVIKKIKELMNLGLKESKDVVDAVEKDPTKPAVIKSGISKSEAEALVSSLTEAGAQAEIK